MVDKDGNIWGPDAWPDLVTKHFVDLYKAPEVDILAEKQGARESVFRSIENRRTSTDCTGPCMSRNGVDIMERKSQPEEYDEHLVAFVDGSYFPPNGCKVAIKGKGENQTGKRNEMSTPDRGRIGWRFVVVREHEGEESEVLWADQGTCESDGISEETANIKMAN